MKKLGMIFVLFMVLATMAAPAWAEPIIVDPGDGGTIIDRGKSDGKLPVPSPDSVKPGNTNKQATNPINNGIKIIVNGNLLTPDVAPFIDSANRVQAPYRAIAEAINCKVGWDEKSQTVTCTKEGFSVKMVIGKKQFTVNDENKTMDTSPMIKNGRTFIPVRALGEAVNSNVNWDEKSRTVTVTSK